MGTREAAPSEEVFRDKEALHVKTVCVYPAPRQTILEKTRGSTAGCTSMTRVASFGAAATKLENSRRWQWWSVTASTPASGSGMDDGEAFLHVVETFIVKQQTRFHREESLIVTRPPWGIK